MWFTGRTRLTIAADHMSRPGGVRELVRHPIDPSWKRSGNSTKLNNFRPDRLTARGSPSPIFPPNTPPQRLGPQRRLILAHLPAAGSETGTRMVLCANTIRVPVSVLNRTRSGPVSDSKHGQPEMAEEARLEAGSSNLRISKSSRACSMVINSINPAPALFNA
jgi:hypothetical protein